MRKMKKLFKVLLLVLMLTISTKVYAATASLSVSSGTVNVGDSFTASINVTASSWDVKLSSSDLATNCTIHEADASPTGYDVSRTFNANCIATGEGTISLTLSGDITNEAEQNITVRDSKSVTVVKKAEPTPTPTPDNNNNNNNNNNQENKPEEKKSNNNKVKAIAVDGYELVKVDDNNNSNNNNNNNNNNQENKPEEKKSNNNKVKAIAVDGYELVKVDDNNYTLSVDNKVEKINIQLAAEDAKATVIGTGEKELKVGENTIEIIVQAEDGTQNKITVKVTRETEKKVIPKKNDTEKDTKKDTKKESSKKDLKVTILLIILFVLDIVLAATVILLALQNNKLRKNRY